MRSEVLFRCCYLMIFRPHPLVLHGIQAFMMKGFVLQVIFFVLCVLKEVNFQFYGISEQSFVRLEDSYDAILSLEILSTSVSSAKCFFYWPLPGLESLRTSDFLNFLASEVSNLLFCGSTLLAFEMSWGWFSLYFELSPIIESRPHVVCLSESPDCI